MASLEGRSGGLYTRLVSVFGLVILAYSVWTLLSAFDAYNNNNMEQFYIGVATGLIGLGLGTTSLFQLRKRTAAIRAMALKVSSAVACKSCGFKVVRPFGVGDFVHKQVGKCQQCNGATVIASIYAETPEK